MAIGRPRFVALCGSMAASALLIFSTPAAGDFLKDQLAKTRAEKRQVQGHIAKINHRSGILTTQLTSYKRRIDALSGPIARLDSRVAELEAGIQRRTERIENLRKQFVDQRHEIRRLEREIKIAREDLAQRLVILYETDGSDIVNWMAGEADANDLIDRAEYVNLIAELHVSVLQRIQDLQRTVRIERARNHTVQASIRSDIANIEAARKSLERDRATLAVKRAAIDGLRAKKAAYLARLNTDRSSLREELDTLDEDTEQLKNAIENGGVYTGGSFGTNSGVNWPVNGPIVSGFGWRWGRMHEGVDIAVGTGVPIHASASGIVVHAGWMGGYGNLVLIQHSGNFVTAYAHQSQIATVNGQFVSQGQVIGYVGCTGHCFGPHVHFETRVNGSAVDPMNYL